MSGENLYSYVLSSLALFIVIFLQQWYDVPFFNKSLVFIPQIQAGATSAQINWWRFFTDTGLTAITFLPTAIMFLFIDQRPRAFYYLYVTILLTSISAVAKLNAHEARPFWVENDVQAF